MLNLDTHMVVAILKGDLSERERRLILSRRLAISDIVNWELAKLVQLGRLHMDLKAAEFKNFQANLFVLPITMEIAVASTRLDFTSDPADEIIAATSVVHEIPLLTRDRRILASNLVPLAATSAKSQS